MVKRKIFVLLLAIVFILPCAIFVSSCCADNSDPKATGITVSLNGQEVNSENNTITTTYGVYQNSNNIINDFISVSLNYDDGQFKTLTYGANDGFSVSGLPQILNANETGYNLSISYKDFEPVSVKLIINKATIDMSNASWDYYDSNPFTYNKQQHSISIINLPEGVTVDYEGNVETNAGNYIATASLSYDITNYKLVNNNLELVKNWSINKAVIDLSYASWNYNEISSFTYDAEQHSISIINLPEEVTVEYQNNSAINAGTYNATAKLIYDSSNYVLQNNNIELSKEWKIKKASINMSGVYWDNYSFDYDGSIKTVSILNLPTGVTVNYQGVRSAKNAGTYTTTATLIYDKTNYELVGNNLNLSHEWTIYKASIDCGEARWNYNYNTTYIYDGQLKSVEITGLPDDVTVTYKNNSATDAGNYTATATFVYDSINYELTFAPSTQLEWKIEKATNSISGELVFDSSWTYGETPSIPSGLSALYGEIVYKYYINDGEDYTEISAPTNSTNAGSYYIAGHSVGNNNYVAQQTEYKKFTIDVVEIPFNLISNPSIKLEKNSFIHTGSAYTPNILEKPNENLVNITGDLTAEEIGNYQITFEIKDKVNYVWKLIEGHSTENQTLNWSIINSPLTMTLNNKELSASEFEALSQFNIGDNWYVTVNGDYNYSLNYEYVNTSNNKVWSGETDEGLKGLNSNFDVTVNPSHFTYIIKITQNAEVVYTKTITVNHDIFENVMVGDIEMTFDEFVANPEVEYGKNLKFNLKKEYSSLFTLTQNDFTVTDDTTITINYELNGERVYKIIEVNCLKEPIESIQVNQQTFSYEEFCQNPVVKYGDEISINLKSSYQNFHTNYPDPFVIKNDIQIEVYTANSDLVTTIKIVCKMDYIKNIKIDEQNITFEEFLSMTTIPYGSTLTFTVNDEFTGLIDVTMYNNNNGQYELLNGEQVVEINNMNSLSFTINDSLDQSYIIKSFSLSPLFFDNVTINNKNISLTQTNIVYDKDLNEDDFTISIDENLLLNYEIYYEINLNHEKVELNQATIQFLNQEIKDRLTFYIKINNEYEQVLDIYFEEFSPIKTLQANIYEQDEVINNSISINNNKSSLIINGAIVEFDIVFKEKYQTCDYKIFNENNVEIQDFSLIQDGIYFLKIYLKEVEIYSCSIDIKYQFNDLIDGMNYVGDKNKAVLFTNTNQLSVPELIEADYFTNQSITFDNLQVVELSEGQQEVDVLYTFTANNKTFEYSFILLVEYVPQIYVSNINITYKDKRGNPDNINFDSNFQFSNGEYKLSDMAFVEENDILIDTIYPIVSKEIKFSEDKTLCWLEYVIFVDGQNKTFRAYIKTSGTISNNTNAQIIFSDAKTVNLNITDLMIDDCYTIDKVNAFGNIEINLEDENARIQLYFNNELLNENYLEINAIGTYTIKITSSDNNTTRTVTIIVKDYESLMFEVFYGENRLFLENGNNGPIGNMKIKYDEERECIYFVGYFGSKNPDDETQVTLSGNTIYENMIYYDDMITPIRNLNNLVLNLLVDNDGSITGIVGGEYVLIYMIVENLFYPVYFVFEEELPYPMTFAFDKNGDGNLDENDTYIKLKLNLDDVHAGIIDLGDFNRGEIGLVVNVSKNDLGMEQTEMAVTTTISWLSTFEDYSYSYVLEKPEGQEELNLVGPTSQTLQSTVTLNFVDNGNGKYIATIYVCSENTTENDLPYNLVDVQFILNA